MAGEFSLRKIWTGFTQMPGKVLDYGSDVLKGTGTLLQSSSPSAALGTVKTGLQGAVDYNKDGKISASEGLRAWLSSPTGVGLNALANIGDPTRGTAAGDVKTGAGVKSSISMPNLSKLTPQTMPMQTSPVEAESATKSVLEAVAPSATISSIMGAAAGAAGTALQAGRGTSTPSAPTRVAGWRSGIGGEGRGSGWQTTSLDSLVGANLTDGMGGGLKTAVDYKQAV